MVSSKLQRLAPSAGMPEPPQTATRVATLSPELVLVDPELGAVARAAGAWPADCLATRPRSRPVRSELPPTPPPQPPAEHVVAVGARERHRRPSVVTVVAALFAALVILSPALDLVPGLGDEQPRLVGRDIVRAPATPDRPSRPSTETAERSTPTSSRGGPKPQATAGQRASKTTPPSAAKQVPRGRTPKPAPTKARPTTPAKASKARASGTPAGAGARTASDGVRLRWQPAKGADVYNVIFWGDGKRVKDLWVKTSTVVVGLPAERSRRAGLPAGTYTWFVFPGYRSGKRVTYGDLAGSGSLTLNR